jgi:hypothetical protein
MPSTSAVMPDHDHSSFPGLSRLLYNTLTFTTR